jgi:hypothetical protein
MFIGVFSSSSKSKPYRNISRNKVSAIYAHYNNIKPLYLDGEAMGVSCICRQYGEGAQVTFAPCFNLTSNLKFLIAPPCCGHTLILIVHACSRYSHYLSRGRGATPIFTHCIS